MSISFILLALMASAPFSCYRAFMKKIILTTSLLLLAACSQSQSVNKGSNLVTYERGETNMGMIEWVDAQAKLGHEIAFENSMDAIAADFVKLALRLGQVDGDYVDAYHGPKVWKEAADNTAVDKATLASDCGFSNPAFGI